VCVINCNGAHSLAPKSVTEICKLSAPAVGVTTSIQLTVVSDTPRCSEGYPHGAATRIDYVTNTSSRAHKACCLVPLISVPINVLRDSQDISVNVVTTLRSERPRYRSSIRGRGKGFCLPQSVLAGFRTYAISYPMDTGNSFAWADATRA
jgi:hypothetical protein